ncbi:pyridoxal 5'-phosphate synthase synthase subunit Pdx1 [Penicillium malachiteum]|nr:pyridoxal 5'-phosphate synthase synthase subunit Pdx1 [Penicillium malachiteum]
MRLHDRGNQSQSPQARAQETPTIAPRPPATPASIPVSRIICPPPTEQAHPTEQVAQQTFPESNGYLESGTLLDWLMSDMHGTSVVPLPLLDLPPGNSNASDMLNYQSTDLEVGANDTTGNTALNKVYRMIDDLSRKLNSDFHRSGFTAAFLDSSLQEFFTRISPNFPVIHKPTFSPQRTIPPLLLNMVALGSLFVCEKDAIQKGEMIWRLGHTAVATSWQTLIELRGPWDSCDGIQLVLAALLGQTYALLSSNPSIRTTASVFHGLGFYWARSSGMYTVEDCIPRGVRLRDLPEAERIAIWRTWAAGEVQRRAILGHYILDGLISQASGSPTSAKHLINSVGMACSDAAFTAETLDEWLDHVTDLLYPDSQLAMSEAFTRVFDSNYNQSSLGLSRLSLFVMIEGIQSVIADFHETSGPVFGAISEEQIIKAMLNIHRNIEPSSFLESPLDPSNIPALIRWHSVFIELTAPSISIYRALCNRYELPQVIGGIHAKSRNHDLDLDEWVMKTDTLRAFLHAITIIRLLENIPLSQVHTMHIPTAVFASAMVIASICILDRNTIEVPVKYSWDNVWDSRNASMINRVELRDKMLVYIESQFCDSTMVSLLEMMNSLQVILKTVASQWGVSAQMRDIIARLAAIAHESQPSQTSRVQTYTSMNV